MNTILFETKRVLRQPAFIVAFVLLLLAAVGLNGATQLLKLHFRKLPVPLRQELSELPDRFTTADGKKSHWVCVAKDETLGTELEETLGTKQFIFRDYVDTRIVDDPAKIEEFDRKDAKEQRILLGKLRETNREKYNPAIINCAVTYYTGKADTVAHIPDRCYLANGYRPTNYDIVTWDVAKTPQNPEGKLNVRFIEFEDQTGASQVKTSVAYFFHTNAKYEQNPDAVRLNLQKLQNRHAYYAKIEVQMLMVDRAKCADVMADFLSEALPDIERALPDQAYLDKLDQQAQ